MTETPPMSTRPDFSPRMLQLFLVAHCFAQAGFRKAALRRAAAIEETDAFAVELMRVSGLPFSAVRAAFDGRLSDAGQRTRLWAILGICPADHGVMLDDAGGQIVGQLNGKAAA